jgi:potassium efflux system protein
VTVGVEYGTDAERVLELLREIGQAHPAALKTPAPLATLAGFGSDSVNFSLRVWTDQTDIWMSLGSDLLVSIYARFEREGICIPNVQRDLHIRSIDAEAVRALRGPV